MHTVTITPLPPPLVRPTQNQPSSDVEIQISQSILVQSDSTMAQINVEMNRLRPAGLALQQLQRQHNFAMSSLRHIPNEILAEIMKEVMPGYDPKMPLQSMRTACTLASVCSRWRDTAISTPQLWTVIEGHNRCRDRVSCASLMQMSLSRSGDLTITVRIGCLTGSTVNDELLPIVVPHIHRIGQLVVSSTLMENAVILCLPMPRLRKLALSHFTAMNLIRVFEECPLLEDVQVTIFGDIHEFLSVPPGGVIMHHLQQLTLSYENDPTAFIDLLTTPNLLEFSTGTPEPGTRWPEERFLVFLHRSKASLKKLHLGFSLNSTSGKWHKIIDSMPHLNEVLFDETDDVLLEMYEKLTFRVGSSTSLPSLKTLVIRSDNELLCPTELFAMILSRATSCPLSKVVLILQEDTLPNFKKGPFGTLWREASRLGYVLEVIYGRGHTADIEDHIHKCINDDSDQDGSGVED